ncbi:MAG: hypothetical protein AB7O38_14855, partial [Pirellulaceae bacterium]
AAHGVQLALARGLRLQLREIAGRYDQSVATNARLEALRHELETNRHFAELYTYLEHPWPRTQMLLAVTQTMPDPVVLLELQIPHNAPPSTRRPANASGETPASEPAARQDLVALQQESHQATTEVILKGLTTDDAALHRYVAGFVQSPLFASAKLESLESTNDPGTASGSRFEIRLVAQPPYGHPAGPAGPPQAGLSEAVAHVAPRTP